MPLSEGKSYSIKKNQKDFENKVRSQHLDDFSKPQRTLRSMTYSNEESLYLKSITGTNTETQGSSTQGWFKKLKGLEQTRHMRSQGSLSRDTRIRTRT